MPYVNDKIFNYGKNKKRLILIFNKKSKSDPVVQKCQHVVYVMRENKGSILIQGNVKGQLWPCFLKAGKIFFTLNNLKTFSSCHIMYEFIFSR